MHAVLFSVVGWLVREVMVKFIVLAAIYAAVAVLAPLVITYVGGLASPTALNNALSGLPSGFWYFADWFRLSYGLPLCIAAMVAKFSIRRLPVIG